MKKALTLLFAAIGLSAVLSACAAPPAGSSGQSADNGEAALQITQRVDEKEYRSSNQKHLLGRYSYTLPVLVASSDDPALQAAAETFNNKIDSMLKDEQSNWNDAVKDAQSYYDTMGSDNWDEGSAWVKEITYEANQTDTLISLRYKHYVYSGGAHGYTYYTGQMFSVKEGCFVDLRSMTDDAAALEKVVAEEILRQIDEGNLAEEFAYWNDYQDYINSWMEDYSVYFNAEGNMEIIFPAYDLASYAAGAQIFVIDRSVYIDFMNDYGKVLLGADL